jgi:hypothetical protein
MCCRLEERDGVLLRSREKKSGEKENVARTVVTGKTTTITSTTTSTSTNIIIIIISLGNREKKQRNIQEGVVAKSRLV